MIIFFQALFIFLTKSLLGTSRDIVMNITDARKNHRFKTCFFNLTFLVFNIFDDAVTTFHCEVTTENHQSS